MKTGYSTYSIEVKNVKYISAHGRIIPQTAIITFYDKNGNEVNCELFGAIDNDSIYELIKQGKDINLDNCYVRDFSLSVYRIRNGIEKKAHIHFKRFSATNAFFESGISTDFSYSAFSDGDVSFEGSHFAKGKVMFQGSMFGKGNVNFSNTLFREGNLDFSGSVFEDGNFLFKNSIFSAGKKDFQDITFGNGEVSFANTEFNGGDLLFINTCFNSGCFNFKVARISGGRIDFHYSVFGECDIIFERTEFGDSKVDFRAVDFGLGKVNFNRSVFGNGEVNFEGASGQVPKFLFKKVAMGTGPKNFSMMNMENTEGSFERTDFGDGDVSYYESKFRVLSLKSCHLGHYVDLRLAKTELLDISDTVVRDIIDLEAYDFPVEIKTIDLSGMRLVGKLYIDWEQNNCKEFIISQEGNSLRQKAEQFRILKENFNGNGRYDDEDSAYVMFKRFEARSRLTIEKQKKGVRKYLAWVPYGFQWLIYDKIGLYATSPGRVLFSVIVLWFFFGSVYLVMDITGLGHTASSVGNPDKLPVLLQSFYHSAITFFTIGYGDVYPTGFSRLVSGLEGFIGVFMMSYFTVAFVRKVLR
jgi:hypothetical protein